MSLSDKVREAFNKDKRIREANKWDPDSQPNLYELYNFLRKSGYRLVDVAMNEGVPELFIEAVEPGHLYPKISQDVTEGNFYIEVTQHGLLVASDVEEIIKGYENALGVVRYLEKLDIESLEIEGE